MAAVGIQYYSGVDAFDLRHFADKELTVWSCRDLCHRHAPSSWPLFLRHWYRKRRFLLRFSFPHVERGISGDVDRYDVFRLQARHGTIGKCLWNARFLYLPRPPGTRSNQPPAQTGTELWGKLNARCISGPRHISISFNPKLSRIPPVPVLSEYANPAGRSSSKLHPSKRQAMMDFVTGWNLIESQVFPDYILENQPF